MQPDLSIDPAEMRAASALGLIRGRSRELCSLAGVAQLMAAARGEWSASGAVEFARVSLGLRLGHPLRAFAGRVLRCAFPSLRATCSERESEADSWPVPDDLVQSIRRGASCRHDPKLAAFCSAALDPRVWQRVKARRPFRKQAVPKVTLQHLAFRASWLVEREGKWTTPALIAVCRVCDGLKFDHAERATLTARLIEYAPALASSWRGRGRISPAQQMDLFPPDP